MRHFWDKYGDFVIFELTRNEQTIELSVSCKHLIVREFSIVL